MWTLTIAADREYHAKMDGWATSATERIPFPRSFDRRAVTLRGEQVLIGRRGGCPAVEPDIDLVDPRVSPAHALLLAAPNGRWRLVDLGSTTGTFVNDELNPIAANCPVPLADGDAIHFGAWTTLRLTR